MRDVRICVFGDSLVSGAGDPRGTGWVGRIAARTPGLTAYPLGVRDESTEEVVVRIPLESAARFARGTEHGLVLTTGVVDAQRANDPLACAAALDFGLASVTVPALVVGPPPVGDAAMHDRVSTIDRVFGRVCQRRGVPYISTFARLAGRTTWTRALGPDGVHPDASGYRLLATAILAGGWSDWLDRQA